MTFNSPNTKLVTLAPGLRPERRFAPLARGQLWRFKIEFKIFRFKTLQRVTVFNVNGQRVPYLNARVLKSSFQLFSLRFGNCKIILTPGVVMMYFRTPSTVKLKSIILMMEAFIHKSRFMKASSLIQG